MTSSPFDRLAPFIREHIYRAGWDALRPVQVKAISAVLDTPDHVLITSGTASGKTEAAFLPILTQLDEHPSSTIGVMYIGPLKALINDQFYRLTDLLEESDIPVQSWHGDIDQGKKRQFLRRGQGVLQITPESLEAMLMRRHTDLARLFGDLRFVVIDEAHAFINNDRGRQVMCQLQRLARYQKTPARRIGLSATLGEPELAMEWLKGGTDLSVTHINDDGGKRSVELGLEHFVDYRQLLSKLEIQDTDPARIAELRAAQQAMYDHVYEIVDREQKTLIFGGSRGGVEELAVQLRGIAEDRKAPNVFHVHHGMIAAPLRESAEDAMRDPDQRACTLATLTLELGIDIGALDQVLQVNATSSVSSFVQRLGRSGRRAGRPARMFFYTIEKHVEDDASLGRRIPWDLLQTIATIQLYVEERWVEPPHIPQLPLSLLYHQTMSTVAAANELTPAQLAEAVLTLSPFQHVTLDQYRELLRHLVAIDHLQQTETNTLIIGVAGERVVNSYWFYATFQDDVAYQVREGSREIGYVQEELQENALIRLAGYVWKVVRVETDQRLIFVERSKGRADNVWTGGEREVNGRILNRIRKVLSEDAEYGYLQDRAVKRLREARRLARDTGMLERDILPIGGDHYMLLPWADSRVFSTLQLLLDDVLSPSEIVLPYYMEVKSTRGMPPQTRLAQIAAHYPSALELAEKLSIFSVFVNKFDRFIPVSLLRAAIAADVLDLEGAKAVIERWMHTPLS